LAKNLAYRLAHRFAENTRTRRSITSCIGGEFFSSPAAIQSTHAEPICPDVAGPDHPDRPPSPLSQHA